MMNIIDFCSICFPKKKSVKKGEKKHNGAYIVRSRLFFPPSHLWFVLCIFIARRLQLFLLSSTRVELCLPTLGALSSWSFLIFANKFRISPRRDSNSRTNTSSIRGIPQDHRGDRLLVLVNTAGTRSIWYIMHTSMVHIYIYIYRYMRMRPVTSQNRRSSLHNALICGAKYIAFSIGGTCRFDRS